MKHVSSPPPPPLPSLTPLPASNAIRVTALVPIHLHGQLALHPEGCAILQRSGHIEEFASVIRDNIESCEDVTKVKATVWALVSACVMHTVCVCACVCVCVHVCVHVCVRAVIHCHTVKVSALPSMVTCWCHSSIL